MTTDEIVRALLYCKHSDGDLCAICPFEKLGTDCSKLLYSYAANRLRYLASEVEEKEETNETE